MNQHYDFYKSLGLEPTASTSSILNELSGRLDRLRAEGAPGGSAQVQETLTARSILGDEGKRKLYDARLSDDSAPTMTITSLRELADNGQFPEMKTQYPTPAPTQPATAHPQQRDQVQYSGYEQTAQFQQNAAPQAPTQLGFAAPANVTQTYRQDLQPAAKTASYSELWRRCGQLPKFFVGLNAMAALVPAFLFIYFSFIALFPMGGENDLEGYVVSGLATLFAPIAAMALIPVIVISAFWAYKGLVADFPRYLGLYILSSALVILSSLLAINLSVGIDTAAGITLTSLWFICSTAALVVGCLPGVRAWFRNEKIVRQSTPSNFQQN